jgi:hypothetical protein
VISEIKCLGFLSPSNSQEISHWVHHEKCCYNEAELHLTDKISTSSFSNCKKSKLSRIPIHMFPVIMTSENKRLKQAAPHTTFRGTTDKLDNFVGIFVFRTDGVTDKHDCRIWGSVTSKLLRRVWAEMKCWLNICLTTMRIHVEITDWLELTFTSMFCFLT